MSPSKLNITQHYRWQFLRLNKDYREKYDLYVKEINAIKDNHAISEERKRWIIEEIISEVYTDYAITDLFDYRQESLQRDVLIKGECDFAVKKGSLEDIYKDQLNDKLYISSPYLVEQGKDDVLRPRAVQVVIDYNATLQDIKIQMGEILESIKRVRKDPHITRPQKQAEQMIKKYDRYLKVYKLKEYENMTIIDIAIRLDKVKKYYRSNNKKYRNNEELNKACQNISNAYSEAATLVNGGYRKIIF